MDLLLQGLRCPLKVNEGGLRAWHRRGRAAAAWSRGCHDAFGSPAAVWGGVGEGLRFRAACAARRMSRGCSAVCFCVFLSEVLVKLGFASVRAF